MARGGFGLGLSRRRVIAGRAASGGGGLRPPGNLTPPTITRSGTVLTCDPGDWSDSPTSLAYSWKLNGATVVGATSATWSPPASAWSSLFGCEIIGRNSAGQSMPALAQEVYIGIMDVLNLPFVGLSMQRLRAGYTGGPFLARNSSNNPATQDKDIVFAASGWLDNASILSHIGTGGGSCVFWYDQGVTAKHASQLTAVNQPRVASAGVLDMLNGRPAIRFTGAMLQSLVGEGYSPFLDSTPVTMFAVVNIVAGTNWPSLFGNQKAATNTGGVALGFFSNETRWVIVRTGAGFADFSPIQTAAPGVSVILTWEATLTNGTLTGALSVNGGTPAVTSLGGYGAQSTGYRVGAADGASMNATLAELIAVPANVSAADKLLLTRNRGAAFNITVA